jgi:hypothetical protein
MYRVSKIVTDNNSTFYRFDSNEKISIRGRIVTFIFISLVLAFFVNFSSVEFLSDVIAVQSILIGFSFSVMFFLISGDNLMKGLDEVSIEAKLKFERLENLSKEIFFNISYFNMVAMICIFFAIILLIDNPLPIVEKIFRLTGSLLLGIVDWVFFAIIMFVKFAFFFFLIESFYSFVRITGRVNFFFERKLEVQKKK